MYITYKHQNVLLRIYFWWQFYSLYVTANKGQNHFPICLRRNIYISKLAKSLSELKLHLNVNHINQLINQSIYDLLSEWPLAMLLNTYGPLSRTKEQGNQNELILHLIRRNWRTRSDLGSIFTIYVLLWLSARIQIRCIILSTPLNFLIVFTCIN